MIRQNIILGNFTYIVDLYKAGKDFDNESHYDEFVVFKTHTMINNIVCNKDVFFVKRSIVESCVVDGRIDMKKLGSMIAFPITNNLTTMSYASDYRLFNDNYIEENFNISGDGDISLIYDTPEVLCDKIRIWLPITKSKLKSLVHITNIINDVRFHYVCENLAIYDTNANGELKVGNETYSEYIDLWIPNVEDLFAPSSHYVKEDYNVAQFRQKITYRISAEDYFTLYPTVCFDQKNESPYDEETRIFKAFKLEGFTTNGTIDPDDETQSTIIINDDAYKISAIIGDETICLKFNPIYATIEPIELDGNGITIRIEKNDEVVKEYTISQNEIKYENSQILCSIYMMILPFFVEEQSIMKSTYGCKTFFNVEDNLLDNILANPIVVSLYPFSSLNETTKTYEASTLPENSDVFTLSNDLKLKISFEFEKEVEDNDYTNYGAYILNCKFNHDDVQAFYLKKTKMSIYDYLDDKIIDNGEYDDDIFSPLIDKCGFIVEISPDSMFKTKLYEYAINMDIADENSEIIKDYKFKLKLDLRDNMWNAYPNSLVLRVKYVDKVSFTIIGSNPLFITTENFKYIINNESNRLALFDAKQKSAQPASNIYANLDDMAFNFIDKINCTIVTEGKEDKKVTNSKTTQKIVFKPVFYKAKDLQQMKLKSGITQNVGLNLSDMMSKADTFKIKINSIEYPEVARNDAYVIFKINAQDLATASGQYLLIDQDDQYISDGAWYTY